MASLDLDRSFGGIAGLDQLKSPHPAFQFTRRERPPPLDVDMEFVESRIPLNPAIQRKASKGGLRQLFTRNRVERTIVSPTQDDPNPHPAGAELSMRGVGFEKGSFLSRTETMSTRTPTTPVPPKSAIKPSTFNARSKSLKQSKPTNKPSPKLNTKPSPNRPARTSPAWDPPPLFQAYPQAIKYAPLMASTLSADSILRMSNHKRNSSTTTSIQAADGQEPSAAAKKTEKASSKHRRQISDSISKAEWTQKIFVLVTSGYLLQYSGEGHFDRLPEKMMQLGKDSVAFASDVIPGRHWVLQISQSMDADGTPMADTRSFLSRLTFRGADYRRTATSLLLVLNSAEEMDSWLAAVRREIEALGGKKHVSETGAPKKEEETIIQLRSQPSHRYLIQRDSDQYSSTTPSRANSLEVSGKEVATTLGLVRPATQPSGDRGSLANSFVSQEGRQLEDLRNSSNRISYMSSGQRTYATSHCSSPERSPTRGSTSTDFEDVDTRDSMEEVRPRPNASAISERRRSMQTVPIPILETQTMAKLHRHSTYGSAATPNFSVPNSSSRRYASSRNSAVAISNLISSPAKESSGPRTRRAPPHPLTIPRSLSPVKDSPSPRRTVPVFTPTHSSFKLLQQSKVSIVDIPPRSPLATPSPVKHPERRSSLLPVDPDIPPRSPSATPSPVNRLERRSSLMPVDPVVPRATTLLSSPDNTPIVLQNGTNLAKNAETSKAITGQPLEDRPIATDPVTSPAPEPIAPLPNIANTKTKLRRPASMQVRPFNVSHSTPRAVPARSATPMSSTYKSPNTRPDFPHLNGASKTSATKPIAPSLQRLRLESNAKAVVNRKSMPLLVGGPPPAPPPDCALPPIPPPGSRESVLASKRSSLHVG